MTPLKTTLRGAIGIKAGLGRDDITLDFESILPDDAVTIAIKGDNGAGKSTLMNLGLTPWLNPPQLPGNIYDEFGDSGERIIEWRHNGERYRSTIQYRQTAKTKSTKAYLHVFRQGDWTPVTLPDHTASDGKAGTYDACVSHILGAQSIYYLSAFRAQNAPSIADYDDPKSLMRDLLNLDEPQALSRKAGNIRLALEREYRAIKDRADTLEEKAGRLREVEGELQAAQGDTAARQAAKQQADEAHALAKAEAEQATSKSLDQEKIRAARRTAKERIDKRAAQYAADKQQLAADRQAAEQRWLLGMQAIVREQSQIEADSHAAERRIASKQALLSEGAVIRQRADLLPDLTASAAMIDAEIVHLTEQAEAKRKAALALTAICHTLDTVKREGIGLRDKLDDLTRRATYVEQVPCGGAAPYDTCPALTDAIRAAEQALSTDSDRKQKLGQYRQIEQDLNAQKAALDAMGDPEREISEKDGQRRLLQADIQDAQRAAAQLPSLASAEEDINGDNAVLEDLRARMAQAKANAEAAAQAAKAEAADIEQRGQTLRAAAEQELSGLQQELEALPLPSESDAVAYARRALQDAAVACHQAEQALAENTSAIAQMTAEAKSLKRDLTAGADLSRQAVYLEDEIAQWDTLSRGLKGVVDLSIEDAGPGIAAIANRLLAESYGPRFSLRIVSQREQQNGRLVECFDISVIDAESGIETSIVHKSGGESVWLDKAMTDAVGLYHQDSAGVRVGTLFADEAEDGLTAERKQQFYRMDRAALDLGGYVRKFFVSHNPDAWDMADAVIDMNTYRGNAQ